MKYSLLSLLILFFLSCKAQQSSNIEKTERPKLVVGVVVDQMRYDYLTRFYDKYGEGGFKRLMSEGFNCKNNHFNYIPTKTGPGHASIFTGTTPKYHGIIGNDWYDRDLKDDVNCVDDYSVHSVGADTKDGEKSPQRMLTTTFADENRLFTQMRGKTIGISIKHRGATLPAGHTANAAYWWDYEHNGSGNWITSTFYMNELPKWVKDFNASKRAETYFKVWNTLYDIKTYTESGEDLNTYERIFKGKETATFPYDLTTLKDQNEGFKIIAESPFGNCLITDFTLVAIDAEELGKDDITDVLTVSYSSTDKVGHDFGVNSKEIEDTYIRLDLEIERLLNALDEKVGKGNYTLFLTSDHGAPDVPNYMLDHHIPAGLFDEKKMMNELNTFLAEKYNIQDLIVSRINNQVYFDYEKVELNDLDLEDIKEITANKLLKYPLIEKVYVTSEINHFEGPDGYVEKLLRNGHNQKRSGDLLFVYTPQVFKDTPWNRTGTDHYSGYNYDTHVPLLFFGKGIRKGSTDQRTDITDIAPTMSAMLNISFPNGSIGKPLEFIFDK